jgi:hypothetical protein
MQDAPSSPGGVVTPYATRTNLYPIPAHGIREALNLLSGLCVNRTHPRVYGCREVGYCE